MKFFNRFKNLIGLALIIMIAFAMAMLGVPAVDCVVFVACWQLLQIAATKRRRYVPGILYTLAISEAQVKEFEEIIKGFKDMGGLFKDLDGIAKSEGGFAAIKKLPELLSAEGKRVDEIQKEINKLRKALAETRNGTGAIRWIGNVPLVTDDCARALTSTLVLQCQAMRKDSGMSGLHILSPNASVHQKLVDQAREFLGVEVRAGGALTPTDIPLPTIYMPQVIELVFAYGQARQFGTVFPLGAGTVKLPRLKAGEDDFAFLGAGTAGLSQQIGQKEVTAELITFTANKAGGLIRIPFELEEDTFIQMGQFLARYIARQFAKLEDKTMFMADGSGTYANITGVGTYCVNNNAYLHQLGAGKTVITDATLADFRALRALVNPAVLANMAAQGQTSASYFMHPSLENLLASFNVIGTPQIYIPAMNGQPAKLDGFPIRWIGVSAANNGNAQANAFMSFFGDLSYWFLGERGAPRVEVSREVFFQTDELAMRALERIDVEGMAIDAMATMQLAAA